MVVKEITRNCEKFHKEGSATLQGEPISDTEQGEDDETESAANSRNRSRSHWLIFMVAAGVAYAKVGNGYDALGSLSDAQNVTLSYSDDGQLIDRGTTEGAEAIMTLLTDEWDYSALGGQSEVNASKAC